MILQLQVQRLDHLSEKLISNFYFDYNASAPFAENVKNELAKGAFYSNPSAFYSSGKKSKSLIEKTKSFLKNSFSCDHEVVFHSGATEGINLVLKGFVPSHLIYISTDHSAVKSSANFLQASGVQIHEVSVNSDGEINYSNLEKTLLILQNSKVLLNITWVNNETGVVADLKKIEALKNIYNFSVHLDAAQAPGKISDFTKFPLSFEAITFSGHKFGALTGVGFSFLNQKIKLTPLIHGGGQQNNYRSGTENTLGIFSLQLALEELISKFNSKTLSEAKNFIEKNLEDKLLDKIIVLGKGTIRNLNTINLIYKATPSDQMLIAFDLKGIELSAGSACSSGRLKASHVLTAMGLGDLAHNGLRFSFSPFLSMSDAKLYSELILSVFNSN